MDKENQYQQPCENKQFNDITETLPEQETHASTHYRAENPFH